MCGNEVVGEARAELLSDGLGIGTVIGRDHVRNQARVPVDDTTERYGGRDTWDRADCSFDLARLDAEPPDLQLFVEPPEVHQRSVRPSNHRVPGRVEPMRGTCEGIGHELPLREFGIAQVAERECITTDEELARDPGREQSTMRIEDMERGVADRMTDGDPQRMLRHVGDLVPAGECGGFGRTVRVHQRARRRVGLEHAPARLCISGLAADPQDPQRPEHPWRRLGVRVEQGRRQKETRHAVRPDGVLELIGMRGGPWFDDDRSRTVAERPPDLPRRGVEAGVGRERHAVIGRDAHEPRVADESDHRPVGDDDGLRVTRRTRREHHVDGRRRAVLHRKSRNNRARRLTFSEGYPAGIGGRLEHQPGRNEIEELVPTRLRVVDRDRNVDAVGEQHREHRGDALDAASEQHRYRLTRAGTCLAQLLRHDMCVLEQFRVRDLSSAIDGNPVGSRSSNFGHECVDGRRVRVVDAAGVFGGHQPRLLALRREGDRRRHPIRVRTDRRDNRRQRLRQGLDVEVSIEVPVGQLQSHGVIAATGGELDSGRVERWRNLDRTLDPANDDIRRRGHRRDRGPDLEELARRLPAVRVVDAPAPQASSADAGLERQIMKTRGVEQRVHGDREQIDQDASVNLEPRARNRRGADVGVPCCRHLASPRRSWPQMSTVTVDGIRPLPSNVRRSRPEAHETLHDSILAHGSTQPDAPAIFAPGHAPCTYRGLTEHVESMASTLAGIGLRRVDRVALLLGNGSSNATTLLGVMAAAVAAPLNPQFTADELRFYLHDLCPAAFIVDSTIETPALEVAAALGVRVFTLTPATSGVAGDYALDRSEFSNPASPAVAPALDDVALLLHTSGTTNRPKLVPLTHANLAASAHNVARTLELGPADRSFNVMPLFHIHWIVASLLASLVTGGSVICTPGFRSTEVVDWMAELQPTWYTAVPTLHRVIADVVAESTWRPALRFVRSSSAPLPTALSTRLEEVFDAPVIEAYGMTEAAHQIASNALAGTRKPGSVGPSGGPEIAIFDPSANVLAAGEAGEIVIRGANVTAGYVDNADANAAAFVDGWLRTGDQGVLDDDGHLMITGRLKEIINRGGEKVAPAEVENALLAHPDVAEAAVFSIPHPRLGEDVAAAVVLRPESLSSEGGLRRFVGERVAPFKVPRRITFV